MLFPSGFLTNWMFTKIKDKCLHPNDLLHCTLLLLSSLGDASYSSYPLFLAPLLCLLTLVPQAEKYTSTCKQADDLICITSAGSGWISVEESWIFLVRRFVERAPLSSVVVLLLQISCPEWIQRGFFRARALNALRSQLHCGTSLALLQLPDGTLHFRKGSLSAFYSPSLYFRCSQAACTAD